MRSKLLGGAATFTATSVLALMLVAGPVGGAHAQEIDQSESEVEGGQTAVAINDEFNDNQAANADNGSVAAGDDVEATNRSAIAGNDANVQADRDSHNDESVTATNRSAAAGSSQDIEDSFNDADAHASHDSVAMAAGDDVEVDRSFNSATGGDGSVNLSAGEEIEDVGIAGAGDGSVALAAGDDIDDVGVAIAGDGSMAFGAGDDVEIQDSQLALGDATSIVSTTHLEGTVTDNELTVDKSLSTGSVLSGSYNFKNFSGINSQNVNSGIMSVGQNANTIGAHGNVTIQ